MALSAGTLLGPYEIVSPLGAGGMGEVYRARDTKLDRDVALKILPETFASDAERLSRFEREAKTLAALNHPHIAHIYGLEQWSTGSALVMELVEGEDLAQRIARGPIAIDDALPIARQICEAIEAAHEQGIVHRDLKPANIKLTRDGTVKILDFGLAKATGAAGRDDVANSPTFTAPVVTGAGMILGTAAYMSPEQARGRAVDRRADIWAFGVVLFEMLTGRQLFTGESASEILAAVIKEEPKWSRLDGTAPPPVERLLRRCLEKDPRKRLSSIADARFDLVDQDPLPAAAPQKPARVPIGWIAAAAITGAAVTALVFAATASWRAPSPTAVARVSVLGPEGVSLVFDSSESAISPDGRHIIFVATDANATTRLWVRSLEGMTAKPLAATENGHLPFWSPDSRFIGFFSNGKLKKVAADGGTVEILCDAKDGRGGTWSAAGVIVFAPSNAGPLQRVSANGGDPAPATALDASAGEAGHRFPWFLPDGRHFLYVSLPPRQRRFDIFVGALDSPARERVTTADTAAVYADPGFLIYARNNLLVAQPFDARTRQVAGDPVTIGDTPGALSSKYAGSRAATPSTTGALAYLSDRLPNTRLIWLDRSGRTLDSVALPEAHYTEAAVAPHGRTAALVRQDSPFEKDVWIADLERGGATRLTFGPTENIDAVWSPDASRVVYATDRSGPLDLYMKSVSGTTPDVAVFKSDTLFKQPRSWSADGRFVVFDQLEPTTNYDLWVLNVAANAPTPQPYLRTSFNEGMGALSPNGRWMAYLSDETGSFELYVDSFPTPRRKYRVTNVGLAAAINAAGAYVFWRRDGKELLAVTVGHQTIVAVDVEGGTEFKAGPPREIVTLPRGTVAVGPAADFSKFLVSVPAAENATSSLTLILNWQAALQKKR